MPATILKIPKQKVQLRCSECGVTQDAKCNCAAPIVVIKPREAASKAIAAHPEKSDRTIAKEIGVNNATVSRARSGVANATPDRRTGSDGKSYPSTQPKLKVVEPKQDDPQVIWRRGLVHRATVAAADAEFENWSGFEVDKELIKIVNKAADAWSKTAAYLEKLYDKN